MAAAWGAAWTDGLKGCLGGLPATSVGEEGRVGLPLVGEPAREFAGEVRREFLPDLVGDVWRESAGEA